jgi:hypothetical protein
MYTPMMIKCFRYIPQSLWNCIPSHKRWKWSSPAYMNNWTWCSKSANTKCNMAAVTGAISWRMNSSCACTPCCDHFQYLTWRDAVSQGLGYVPAAFGHHCRINSGFIAESLELLARGSLYRNITEVVKFMILWRGHVSRIFEMRIPLKV